MTSLLVAALVGYAAATSSSMDTAQSTDSASMTSSMANQSGTSSQAESTSSVQLSDTVISTIVSSLLSHTDATSSVQFSDTVITTSIPTPTGMDACASRCHSLWENCNAPPDANRAQCMADYVSCVGYNFGNGNFPKTCASASRTSSPTPTPSGNFKDECARKCVTEYDQCIRAPEPNLAFCHRKLTDCVGYNPFNQPGGYQQPTACQHPGGGGGNSTVTGVTTITTTYCPPGQSQTTTATFSLGSGGTGPTQTQSNPSSSPVPAGAGRFQPGILALVAVGIALL